MTHLRHPEPVAGEDEGRLELWRVLDPHAEDRVLAEHDGLPLAVAHDREARLFFHDAPRAKGDWLNVSAGPGRRESGGGELLSDVLSGMAMLGRAGFPPAQLIGRKELDVRPPALAVLVVQRGERGKREHKQRNDEKILHRRPPRLTLA